MDGTLLNTEDLYTEAATQMLADFGKGPMTWDVKINLQGRPGPEANRIMIDHYNLPLTPEEFYEKALAKQAPLWPKSRFLPGALELVEHLVSKNIPIALGTSSNRVNFERKTGHLQHGFRHFGQHVVTGDDPRIPPGKGKPEPDIWYACLESLNEERRAQGLDDIAIDECLVFEDGIPGVISGQRAGAKVIWRPHPEALPVLNGREKEIIKDGVMVAEWTDFNVNEHLS